jgi:hypothetical protein
MRKPRRSFHAVPVRAERLVFVAPTSAASKPPHLSARTTSSRPETQTTEQAPLSHPVLPSVHRTRRRPSIPRPVRIMGATMLVFLCLLILWFRFVSPWLTGISDQWQYGQAHISELNANVGHGGTSQFLAEYYRGQVLVIELPMNNHQGMQVYALPLDTPYSTPPVITLTVADFNHDGKPDLQVHVEGDPISYVLFNNGTSFQSTPPAQG